MRIILLILLLVFSCNDSDDLFFVLNPNKKSVLDKEMKECRRDVFLLYSIVNSKDYETRLNESSCKDPNSNMRKKYPDLAECLEKEQFNFFVYVAASYVSCPKGLTSLD